MNRLKAIYTEKNNCLDCYKCVRECPVKAIKLEDHNASIVSELCIYCGHCTQVCPANAKTIRDDVDVARKLLASGVAVAVSLAPSFVGDFDDCSPLQLIEALRRLGFTYISETALGAQWVSARTAEFLDAQESGVFISSACPSVVELVQKYHPEHLGKLTPILSPMQAHGKMLRAYYQTPLHVVFFGPCIAKKCELDSGDNYIDVALTFKDLKQWFSERGIIPGVLPES
jgi:iron only hydrogenase large subunit-like protein